jgi:hypothetical protein
LAGCSSHPGVAISNQQNQCFNDLMFIDSEAGQLIPGIIPNAGEQNNDPRTD